MRPHSASSVEFDTTGYYDLGRFQQAGSQDTNLSCNVTHSHFLLHSVITIHQCYTQIDERHAFSISVTCYAV